VSFNWLERLSSHMGAEKHPTVGSSGGSRSINIRLNQWIAGMKDLRNQEG